MTAQQKLDALRRSRLWKDTKKKYPHLADIEVDLYVRKYLTNTKKNRGG